MPRTAKAETSKGCTKTLKDNEKKEKYIKMFKAIITNTGKMAGKGEEKSHLWAYGIGRGWTMVTNVLSCSVVDTEIYHQDAPAMKSLSQLQGMPVAENFQLSDPLGIVSMAKS